MMIPFFSVVIPAYKVNYLKEAIDSILNQTYNDYEIVIVNDASPYNIKNIIGLYNDDRIRYFENKENCGAINVVDNWNICLSYVKGKYVICMGDDDKLLPTCLMEYSKLMAKYPNLGVYHAWTELIDEKSEFYSLQQPRPEFESALSLAWNRWNGRNKQYIGDFCFNVDLLRKDGGFYKTPLAWGSDTITAIKAAMHGGIANTQVLCFQYRVNRYTISNSGHNDIKIEALMENEKWFTGFIMKQEQNISLSSLDKKYLKCIKDELPKYFKRMYISGIQADLKNHRKAILKWIKKANQYDISMGELLICWMKSLR